MLTNQKITITADTIVDDEKIATFGASLDANNMELSMIGRYVDKEAYKMYRDIVSADQAMFEEYAYEVQDMLNSYEKTHA